MFSGIFAKAKVALGGNPRPAPVPIAVPYVPPAVVPVFSRTPSVPEVSPRPKRADVETIGISYALQMQEIRIGKHSTSENSMSGLGLVGGR